MHLITLGLGLMLLPTGYALRCYVCDPGDTGECTEERQDCPNSSGKCAATTVRHYQGPTKYTDVTEKSCEADDECVTSSVHLKDGIATTQCCCTDLCNTMAPPVNATPNGLKCYTCQDDDCSHILSCTGDRDHCFSSIETDSEGNVETTMGCISKSMCYHHGLADGEKAEECCEGDLCNNAEFRAKSSRSAAVSLTPIITTILASLLLVL